MKKSGGGGRNWGNDASADVDSAAATGAENMDQEGTSWAANGTTAVPEVQNCLYTKEITAPVRVFTQKNGMSTVC